MIGEVNDYISSSINHVVKKFSIHDWFFVCVWTLVCSWLFTYVVFLLKAARCSLNSLCCRLQLSMTWASSQSAIIYYLGLYCTPLLNIFLVTYCPYLQQFRTEIIAIYTCQCWISCHYKHEIEQLIWMPFVIYLPVQSGHRVLMRSTIAFCCCCLLYSILLVLLYPSFVYVFVIKAYKP